VAANGRLLPRAACRSCWHQPQSSLRRLRPAWQHRRQCWTQSLLPTHPVTPAAVAAAAVAAAVVQGWWVHACSLHASSTPAAGHGLWVAAAQASSSSSNRQQGGRVQQQQQQGRPPLLLRMNSPLGPLLQQQQHQLLLLYQGQRWTWGPPHPLLLPPLPVWPHPPMAHRSTPPQQPLQQHKGGHGSPNCSSTSS
jgi:hypothetical protein